MVLLEQLIFYTFTLGIFLLSAFEAEHKELTDCLIWKIQQRILIIKRYHMESPKSKLDSLPVFPNDCGGAKPCMISPG